MQKNLKDTASMSFEAKAAIIGAVYALERLFSASNQRGTNLTNLNALLGTSSKTLQQYDYAARQVGASNEEMEGTFKSLQNALTNTRFKGETPAGLTKVLELSGGSKPGDIDDFINHPEKLIQRLQIAVSKVKGDVGLRNYLLNTFPIGDNVKAGLIRGAFSEDKLTKAPVYGDREVKSLDNARATWERLGSSIEMAIGHFNARHGAEIARDITSIIGPLVKLTEAFTTLAEKIKIFQLLGDVFKGWEIIFKGISSAVDSLNAVLPGDGKDGKKVAASAAKNSGVNTGSAEDSLSSFAQLLLYKLLYAAPSPANDKGAKLPGLFDGVLGRLPGFGGVSALPTAVPTASGNIVPNVPFNTVPAGSTQNNNINMNLNFNDNNGKDAVKTGSTIKKVVTDALQQIPQHQGS